MSRRVGSRGDARTDGRGRRARTRTTGAGRDGKRVGVGGAGRTSRGGGSPPRRWCGWRPRRTLGGCWNASRRRRRSGRDGRRGATCVVADRSWRASLVQSARTPVSVGSGRAARLGFGEDARTGAKAIRGRRDVDERARARTRRIRRAPRAPSATPGACHDGSNTARSCQLAHLRPGGGGRRADRRAGGHRQAAEQPLSRAGGAKDRHREPKVASRVRVARSVMTRARNRATLTRGYSRRGGRHSRGKSYRHRRHPISRPRPDP